MAGPKIFRYSSGRRTAVRLVSFAFAALFALFLGVADAVVVSPMSADGGGTGDHRDNLAQVNAAIEAAIKEIAQQRRKLDLRGGGKKRKKLDGSSGCDCSADALRDIYDAHQDVLSHVPLIMMGLIKKNADYIVPGGLPYNPTEEYEMLAKALKRIVGCAAETISDIECGYCNLDDEGYKTSDGGDKPGQPRPRPPRPPRLYDPHGAETAYEGISHFECCCDMNLTKDLVIKKLRSIAEIVKLNPGAYRFTEVTMEALTLSTKKAIRSIAKPYKPPQCPCYTRQDLDDAASGEFRFGGNGDFTATGFSFYGNCVNGENNVAVQFNPSTPGQQLMYQVCAGMECAHNLSRERPTCAAVFMGRGGFMEVAGEFEVSEAEETACYDILVAFCTDNGVAM